jgi:hypothetical protein
LTWSWLVEVTGKSLDWFHSKFRQFNVDSVQVRYYIIGFQHFFEKLLRKITRNTPVILRRNTVVFSKWTDMGLFEIA